MARKLPIALASTGVVFVVAAALVKWVAAPALVKIPTDVNSTTVAEGRSQVFVLSQQAVRPVDVVATRTVRGDKSAGTGSVAVFDESLCLVARGTKTDARGCAAATDPGFIQKTTDRIAIDRKSALAVADGQRFKQAVDGNPAIQHVGLGYTFPIDTGKKTYPFFDTVAGKPFPMQYQGSEKIHGLTVYRFRQDVPTSNITIQKVLPGTYSNVRTVWVEPTTGVIVKGSEQITERFASNNAVVFQGTLVFNDQTVAHQASYANSQDLQIQLVRMWIPLAALLLGVLLIVAGGFVWQRVRGRTARSSASEVAQPERSQT